MIAPTIDLPTHYTDKPLEFEQFVEFANGLNNLCNREEDGHETLPKIIIEDYNGSIVLGYRVLAHVQIATFYHLQGDGKSNLKQILSSFLLCTNGRAIIAPESAYGINVSEWNMGNLKERWQNIDWSVVIVKVGNILTDQNIKPGGGKYIGDFNRKIQNIKKELGIKRI